MLSLGIQPPCCEEAQDTLRRDSCREESGARTNSPATCASHLRGGSSAGVVWRTAVPSKPCSDCTFGSKVDDYYCFPLPIRGYLYVTINNQSIFPKTKCYWSILFWGFWNLWGISLLPSPPKLDWHWHFQESIQRNITGLEDGISEFQSLWNFKQIAWRSSLNLSFFICKMEIVIIYHVTIMNIK